MSENVESAEVGINPRASGLKLLDMAGLFGNGHPVVLEIGSGKGRFLVNRAGVEPQRNYLGIEKSLHYYRLIVDRVNRRGNANIRVINYDAYPVLVEMLPTSSISEIHIYFPDPWPRPREQKRRLIRGEVIQQLARILEPSGVGIFVTDHEHYFQRSLLELEQMFAVETSVQETSEVARTNYEAKYRQEGRKIYQIEFRRIGVPHV